jgi:hypothetical protein
VALSWADKVREPMVRVEGEGRSVLGGVRLTLLGPGRAVAQAADLARERGFLAAQRCLCQIHQPPSSPCLLHRSHQAVPSTKLC